MCDPVEPTDSRYPGWYCCRDNTFNPAKAKVCRICREHRDKRETAMVIPRPRRKKKK